MLQLEPLILEFTLTLWTKYVKLYLSLNKIYIVQIILADH